MTRGALTGSGATLRRVVVRTVGTLALSAAGLALGVTLAAPSSAVDRGPLGSALGDTVDATTYAVNATTQAVEQTVGALGLIRPAADQEAMPDESGEPVEARPDEPTAPAAEPVEQAEPIKPAEPVEPTKPVKPAEPVKQTAPVEQAEPVEQATPADAPVVPALTERPVAGVATAVERVTEPLLKPVADQAGRVVAPVTEPLGQAVAPVTGLVEGVTAPLAPVLGAVTKPLAPAVGGLLRPVTDVVAPVTGAVGGTIGRVTAPVGTALRPVTSPVTDLLAPVVEPIATHVVAPVVVPVGVPIDASIGFPVGEDAVATDPGELQPSGAVVRQEAATDRVRKAHAVQASVFGPSVDSTIPAPHGALGHSGTDHGAGDTTHALSAADAVVLTGGHGRSGAGFPLAAGGPGLSAGAGTGGVLSGGAPELKVPGSESLAALAGLLAFRAQALWATPDQQRAKLASSYTDIPVSPA